MTVVFKTPRVSDAVRVLLLALAVEMDDAGRVSLPREEIAERLGRGKSRISERIQAAVDAGLLERESAGKKGSTAVYVAALPKGSGQADRIKGPDRRTESEHFGSGPQTQSEHFGSGQADPTDAERVRSTDPKQTLSVRTGGPHEPKKGPPIRVATGIRGLGGSNEDEEHDLFGEVARETTPRDEPTPKKRSPSRKYKIPADFAMDDSMREWARENAPLVNAELETGLFVRHFLDKGVKRPGWRRSWEAWMLRQQNWTKERQERHGNVRHLRATGTNDARRAAGIGALSDLDIDYDAIEDR